MSEGDAEPELDAAVGEEYEHPWLGLVPYGETDAGRFFGREGESAELYRLVQRRALTVVFGPSGTGKSSLLNAGLFPQLRDEHFLPIPIRIDHSGRVEPRQQIKDSIDMAMEEQSIEASPLNEPLERGEESVWEYLHRTEFWDSRNHPVTPVLVFDQFEEVFTLGRNRSGTEQFIDDLADLVENYVPAAIRGHLDQRGAKLPRHYDERHYKIILTLREDFVSRLDALTKVMPSIMYNRFSLARMNGEQALDVILKPGGHLVEEAVAREIVEFVAAKRTEEEDPDEDPAEAFRNQEIEPALLSLVCRELNTVRLSEGAAQITSEQVRKSSDDILEDFYERSFDEINPLGRFFVEDRLVTASGFRSTVPLEDATESGLAEEDVAALVDRRLIRKEDRLGIPHLELTHDVLTGVVQSSRDARRERERLEEERRVRAERARRLRRILLVVGSTALVILGFAVFAVVSWVKAERQARINLNQKLVSKAQEKSADGEFELPLLLRSAAYHLFSKGLTEIRAPEVAPAYYQSLSGHLFGTYRHGEPTKEVIWDAENKRCTFASTAKDGTIEIREFDPEQQDQRARLIATLRAHVGKVRAVRWDPDQQRVASAGDDGMIRIWDLKSPEEPIQLLEGHGSSVVAVEWSLDGSRLASGDALGDASTIRIWDVDGGGKLLHILVGHGAHVSSVAWNGDGTRLASASNDKSVRIWDAEQGGNALLAVTGHFDKVNAVVWAPDGKRIASASDDRTVRIWDLEDQGRQIRSFIGHRNEVWFLSWANGLASGDRNGEIRIWPEEEGEARVILRGHEKAIRSINWSAEDTRVVSASDDGTVRLWDPEDFGGPVELFDNHVTRLGKDIIRAVSWAGARVQLVAIGKSTEGEGIVRIWDANEGEAVQRAQGDRGHPKPIEKAAWNKAGNRLATADKGGEIRIWDSEKGGEALLTVKGPEKGVRSIGWSEKGDRLAAASKDGVIRIWDLEKDKASESIEPLIHPNEKGNPTTVTAFAWNPSGIKLASGTDRGTVRIWDARTGKLVDTFEEQDSEKADSKINALAWNHDGTLLASARSDGIVVIRDSEKGGKSGPQLIHTDDEDRSDVVRVLAWNPAGSLMASNPKASILATGSQSGKIRIWDVDSGKEEPLYVLSGHDSYVQHLAWNQDGTRLASTDSKKTLRIWRFDEESWRAWAKRIVDRNLTHEEWRAYVGSENDYPYKKVFSALPD